MMRLLSYHIENYGKIHNKDGDFSEGVTCYCENNGFGKSTLASFIKAMFYGLPSYTVASKGFNDRQKYYPFEGGKFGGSLTFESAGKTYRLERFFDKKSGKGDELKVYCNGAPFDGFGEELGKTLFGLDEESFKKTIFITADEIEISSTHSINEKLNHTVEGVNEDNDFERAIERLEKVKKELKAARGNNDKISAKQREIIELRAQIKNLQDMSAQLAEEYTEREKLCKEILELELATKEASEQKLILQKWETFDSMTEQKANKTQALKDLERKYPLGVPSEEDCVAFIQNWENSNRLKGTLHAVSFPVEKEEELRILSLKFQNGIPMDELIEENQQKIMEFSALKTEQLRLEKTEMTEQEKQLEKKYALSTPSENELHKNRALAEEYKKKENELKERSAFLLNPQTERTHKKLNKEWYFLILGIALLCAGAGLLFVLQTVGIGLLIAGGILLVVAGALKIMKPTMPPSNEHFALASLQAECKSLKEKLRSFTVPYGYYSEAGVLFDFAKLEEDLQAYKTFVEAKAEREKQAEALRQKAQEIEAELGAFLQTYHEGAENIQNGLNRLTASITAYRALQSDKAQTQSREMQIQASLREAEKAIEGILQKYALDASVATMDGLNALTADRKSISKLAEELDILTKNLFEYQEKNHLTERPENEEIDSDELHAKLFKCRKDLADCDKRIAETEHFVEKLPDAENALLLAEENVKEYKDKYDLFADTIEALKGAEQSLKDKYIAPIKTSFSKYADALERVLDEKISMDQDFRIVFERGGEARSEKHLSAGERSLCALCLRLALIDNMYETESPFIIMDDPFVHLDEAHMERTRTLIRELSKARQIIYFCCHESRRI